MSIPAFFAGQTPPIKKEFIMTIKKFFLLLYGAFFLLLIALGVIFLLDNLGILRMHHLWPLFLIGIGLWIAYKRTAQPSVGGPQ